MFKKIALLLFFIAMLFMFAGCEPLQMELAEESLEITLPVDDEIQEPVALTDFTFHFISREDVYLTWNLDGEDDYASVMMYFYGADGLLMGTREQSAWEKNCWLEDLEPGTSYKLGLRLEGTDNEIIKPFTTVGNLEISNIGLSETSGKLYTTWENNNVLDEDRLCIRVYGGEFGSCLGDYIVDAKEENAPLCDVTPGHTYSIEYTLDDMGYSEILAEEIYTSPVTEHLEG